MVDHKLYIVGEVIPGLEGSQFTFLGMPIQVPSDLTSSKLSFMAALERMLQAIDNVPVSQSQKLRLFKQGLCPRLLWPFTLHSFPIHLLRINYTTTGNLLSQEIVTSCLFCQSFLTFLPPKRGGLGLPSRISLYKKQQASKQVQLTVADPGFE